MGIGRKQAVNVFNMSRGEQGRREIGKASRIRHFECGMEPGGGCWREKSSQQAEQQLQTPAVGTSSEHWGTGEGAVRLEEGAEEVDGEGCPHPPQRSRMRPRTRSSLFQWLVLESEGHSHHWEQWRLTHCLAVFSSG